MNFTVNFILLFLVIVLPGLLFRRFYFYGDFSKQFRIREPLHNLFIANIIPGALLLILAFAILGKMKLITPMDNLMGNVFSEDKSKLFTKRFYKDAGLIGFSTFFLAIALGYILSRIVRIFKLDIKYKILRYKNTWYYILSGEISQFDKFREKINVEFKNSKGRKFIPPNVDVLIEQGNDNILYSGVLLDYEVSQDDLLRLERIYLRRAVRYSKRDKKVVPKEIPGHLFVLNTRKLLNININYPEITLLDKLLEEKSKKEKRIRSTKLWEIGYVLFGIGVILLITYFLLSLFLNIGPGFYNEFRWYQKIIALLMVFQCAVVFLPDKKIIEGETQYKYGWMILTKLLWLGILWLILCATLQNCNILSWI